MNGDVAIGHSVDIREQIGEERFDWKNNNSREEQEISLGLGEAIGAVIYTDILSTCSVSRCNMSELKHL